MILQRRLAAIILFFLCASMSYGQTPLTELDRPISLSITPEYPAPGDEVKLSIKSLSLDLYRSSVIWYANGREISRGDGLTETTLVAGQLGSVTTVEVVAGDAEGITARTRATIIPSEAEITWESDSYVPPLYAGRPLPGSGANIRAYAHARFSENPSTSDRDFVFLWYRDGSLIQSVSGRGKSSAVFSAPPLFSSDTIRVVIERVQGAGVAEALTTITSVDPFVLLYEQHPLFGVLFHRALQGDAETLETELKVTAVPYFARIYSPYDASLSYEWSVAGTPIEPSPIEPQTLTVRAGSYVGPARIELNLTNLSDMYMQARGAWNLLFGSGGRTFFTTNIFGESQ